MVTSDGRSPLLLLLDLAKTWHRATVEDAPSEVQGTAFTLKSAITGEGTDRRI